MRNPSPIALIDIDHFKLVNDTYGHHIGDRMLKQVVKVFNSQLNVEVLFARYGGKEFVWAMKNYTVAGGLELARKVRKSAEEMPLTVDELNISATVSIGVAQLESVETASLHLPLNHTDIALYSAKGKGRNQMQLYAASEEIVRK